MVGDAVGIRTVAAAIPARRRTSDDVEDLILANSPGLSIRRGTHVAPADVVVHCAAAVGQWGDAENYRRVNVEGTRGVMDVFRRARHIYVSSASVYSSDIITRSIAEEAPVRAPWATAYAESKALAEGIVRSCAPEAVILRPRIVYGPGDTTLAPRLRRACRLGYLFVPGDGSPMISATHIDRLVAAIVRGVEQRTIVGTFNIADHETCTVDALLRRTLRAHDIRATVVYVPAALASGLASISEFIWHSLSLPGEPMLTRYVVAGLTKEWTLDTSRSQAAGL